MTRIVRGFHLYLIIAAVLSVATSANASDAKRRPSIVLVMTDDKYSPAKAISFFYRDSAWSVPNNAQNETGLDSARFKRNSWN